MADINRRFSRAQWTNGVPNAYPGQPRGLAQSQQQQQHGNKNLNNSFNVNEQYSRNNNNVLNPNHMLSSESIHSIATNATSATTRRRFSMKLSQPPLPGSFGAPPLPFNAHSQILNSSTDMLSIHSFREEENDDNHLNNGDHSISPQKKQQDLLAELASDQFNVNRFIQMKLGDANATRIDDFATFMENLSKQNDDAFKFSLSESTNQVLMISEAFKQTNDVLLALKPKVNDLSEVLSQQIEEAHDYFESLKENKSNNDSLTVPKSKVNRQSVLLLQNKWANSVNKIYSNVERIHDLLPPSPTRHVIFESLRWGELNSITCKPVRPIQITIFNDAVLICSRLRSNLNRISDKNDNKNINIKNNIKSSSKEVKNIATYAWMIDTITIQKCSEIKELNDIIRNNNSNNIISKNIANSSAPSTANDSETIADSTLCIKIIDTNQFFLFQTDALTEFIRIFNAIKQAKNESAFAKRRTMRDSMSKLKSNYSNRPDSTRASLSQNLSISNFEKQLSPQFESCVLIIDDLFTSVSLELGLHRYDESVGYLTRLKAEIKHLSEIAIALGIPESLLTSKLTTTQKQNEVQTSTFAQHVHFIYNLKLSKLKKITNQLIDSLKMEITVETPNFDLLKDIIDIFKVLKKEREAVEIYLEAKGRELEDCVGMVRVGGGNGVSNGNSSMEILNTMSSGFLNNDRSLSRSNSSKKLNGLTSRPTSMGNTPEPELDNNEEAEVRERTAGSVTGELITAYVRELSLVYMGFISIVWDEWNQLFNPENNSKNGTDSSETVTNVRVVEWINDYIAELKQTLEFTLSDYGRNTEVFNASVKAMKEVFQGLKDKEMNIDYLLEL
jgi:hypothetical protein